VLADLTPKLCRVSLQLEARTWCINYRNSLFSVFGTPLALFVSNCDLTKGEFDMIRKTMLAATAMAGSMQAMSSPAHATWWHTHYCGCGHMTCGSTSGGSTSTSGGSTSSGGSEVPEPGMVGLLGLGLIGMAVARRRRAAR
jgi:hypothetical protein